MLRLASYVDDRASPLWSLPSKGVSPRTRAGAEGTIEPALGFGRDDFGRDDFRQNRRAGSHPHLDHDQSQESLHRVRADVHPMRDLLAAQALQQILQRISLASR